MYHVPKQQCVLYMELRLALHSLETFDVGRPGHLLIHFSQHRNSSIDIFWRVENLVFEYFKNGGALELFLKKWTPPFTRFFRRPRPRRNRKSFLGLWSG